MAAVHQLNAALFILGFREGDMKKLSARFTHPRNDFMNTLVTSIRHNCSWKHTEMRNACNKAATSFFFRKRIFCCEKQWNLSHSGSDFNCEVFCFSGNINSRSGCALSIIFLSKRMLVEASPSLAFRAVPPLHTSRPAARDTSPAFNNVIKPPRALWPSPLPCCVRTLPLPSSKEMNGSTPLQPQSSVCTESRCLLHSVPNKPIVTERKGRISASEIR